jgi:hypothetical protein
MLGWSSQYANIQTERNKRHALAYPIHEYPIPLSSVDKLGFERNSPELALIYEVSTPSYFVHRIVTFPR